MAVGADEGWGTDAPCSTQTLLEHAQGTSLGSVYGGARTIRAEPASTPAATSQGNKDQGRVQLKFSIVRGVTHPLATNTPLSLTHSLSTRAWQVLQLTSWGAEGGKEAGGGGDQESRQNEKGGAQLAPLPIKDVFAPLPPLQHPYLGRGTVRAQCFLD